MIPLYLDCIRSMINFCDVHEFTHLHYNDLKDIIQRTEGLSDMTITSIKRIVSKYFGLEKGAIDADTCADVIVRPRQFAHYYSNLLTSKSLAVIGNRIGKRSHATVINSIKIIGNIKDTHHTIEDYLSFVELEIIFSPYLEKKKELIGENV